MYKNRIALGTTFTTGQKCPESGVYEFARHMDNSYCNASAAEKRIPLAEGDTFPPHRTCNKGVVWKLVIYA